MVSTRWTCAAVLTGCLVCVEAQNVPKPAPVGNADATFKAIYVADEAWRRAQPGNESAEDERRHLEPPRLPHVDAATQDRVLAHWQSILAKLSKVDVKGLSKDERLNYEVYCAQIAVAKNAQTFKEYERPVNSDSQFWGFIAPLDGNEFVSEEHYVRYLSQLNDVPVYFAEQEANLRAGMARGFTPPRVTLEGRDQGLKDILTAKTAQETAFWKPFAAIPASISAARQAELRAAAADVIEHKVLPAYSKMLRFFDDEYVPHAVTALAAESVPDGKAYYQSKILEYATVTMPPEEIHSIGLKEMAGIHAEMLEQMKASGFAGTFTEFLKFLKSDPQFYAHTPQELLDHAAWIAKEFDNVSSRYFGYQPRGRFGIVPVPPEMAPFYTAGRGGTKVYLLNTYDLPSRPLYALPALTLHESAPGHSWQGTIADEQEREKKLPQFREDYISAYGEG